VPSTIIQRWNSLFGHPGGGNDGPDSVPSKITGTDGNGLSGTAAISHSNPLRESSALDEGFNSNNPMPAGHHDADVGILWEAIINTSSSGALGSTVSGGNASSSQKVDAIRKAGISFNNQSDANRRGIAAYFGVGASTRGNHRLNVADTDWDRASASAAAGN
jgi:hypothetical protein